MAERDGQTRCGVAVSLVADAGGPCDVLWRPAGDSVDSDLFSLLR